MRLRSRYFGGAVRRGQRVTVPPDHDRILATIAPAQVAAGSVGFERVSGMNITGYKEVRAEDTAANPVGSVFTVNQQHGPVGFTIPVRRSATCS